MLLSQDLSKDGCSGVHLAPRRCGESFPGLNAQPRAEATCPVGDPGVMPERALNWESLDGYLCFPL